MIKFAILYVKFKKASRLEIFDPLRRKYVALTPKSGYGTLCQLPDLGEGVSGFIDGK